MDAVDDFLIPNVKHLSTLVIMLAQVHHLVNDLEEFGSRFLSQL